MVGAGERDAQAFPKASLMEYLSILDWQRMPAAILAVWNVVRWFAVSYLVEETGVHKKLGSGSLHIMKHLNSAHREKHILHNCLYSLRLGPHFIWHVGLCARVSISSPSLSFHSFSFPSACLSMLASLPLPNINQIPVIQKVWRGGWRRWIRHGLDLGEQSYTGTLLVCA